jgi:arabinofuranan 3-O-arabinosyltransferase
MKMNTRAAAAAGQFLPVGIEAWLGLVGIGLAAAYLVFLAVAVMQGYWLFDGLGRPIANDFVNVYAAGQQTLQGDAPAVYDWVAHKQAEDAAIGYAFDGFFGWHYPPLTLFAAAPLALFPLVPAMLIWLAVTLAAYVAAIGTILSHRTGFLLALGFPAVIWNMSVGQNGFLTAALIGGSLVLLDRRPLASGVLLGLLTYKPQFGILFPLALALDGRWRTIGAAAATALVLAAASLAIFGADSWRAFFAWMPATSTAVFVEGRVDLNKLQSLFGLLRWLGGSMTLATAVQAVLFAACCLAVIATWRGRHRFEVKAATLATAALLATPYLYVYDLVVLAVPISLMIRLGLTEGFLRFELIGLAAVSLLVLVFPFIAAPTGLLATLIMAALIGRRALEESALAQRV